MPFQNRRQFGLLQIQPYLRDYEVSGAPAFHPGTPLRCVPG
jgi:hypothetical protein